MAMRRPTMPNRQQLARLQPNQNWRRLFVTGGMGYLGRHLLNGPATERWNVIAPASDALELGYGESVQAVIADWKPSAIIHTAARKDDRASTVDASRNVAEAAAASGVRLVHVSCDSVFAGRAWAYTESDPATPLTDFGLNKADAERAVLDAHPEAVVVRTSLLVGGTELSKHERKVRDAISGKTDFEFFTDAIRCPALVEDVARSLVRLAERRSISGVIHIAGPDAYSRAELATLIAKRYEWDEEKLRFTESIGFENPVPGRVELDCSLAREHGLDVRGPASWFDSG